MDPLSTLFLSAASWWTARPILTTLALLTTLDVIAGVLRAISNKKLNSTTSYIGMSKKAMMFVVIGVVEVLQPFLTIPITQMVTMFYVLTEAISIIEQAASIGLPLPQGLVEALSKVDPKALKGTTYAPVKSPEENGETPT